MKELNIEIAVKIYDYEELDAADRELMDAAAAAIEPIVTATMSGIAAQTSELHGKLSGTVETQLAGFEATQSRLQTDAAQQHAALAATTAASQQALAPGLPIGWQSLRSLRSAW